MRTAYIFLFFFFNDTATTEIYTLSLHDALPICARVPPVHPQSRRNERHGGHVGSHGPELQALRLRSEEHTSELQSPCNLVCRLLLEKKKRETISRHAHMASVTTCYVCSFCTVTQ